MEIKESESMCEGHMLEVSAKSILQKACQRGKLQ